MELKSPLVKAERGKAKGAPKGALRCGACSHRCLIPDGQAGFCGVRANSGGKFDLLVHSRPCAVWADPIEKKPLFHFLPGSTSFSIGTFGCNFACAFCQNWDISQSPREAREGQPKTWRAYFEDLVRTQPELKPEEAVRRAVGNGCRSVSYTYSEPTIFSEYAMDIMKKAKGTGLKHVYVTNGYQTPECWKVLKKAGLDAANIDLKAFNDKFYRTICKGSLEPVLASIKLAKRLGIWVEVTTLLVPGENDNPGELKAEAEFLAGIDKEMPWHVTAFYPQYKMLDKPPTPPETLLRAREIGLAAGLKHVYCGNVSLSYSQYETTFCPACGKALIERVGFSVTKNEVKDGKCGYCKSEIKGVWK